MNNTNNISPAELYKHYSEDIFRYAYSILREYESARDAVQEVFAKYIESADRFRADCNHKTWLFTLTRNYCYDRLKEKSSSNRSLSEEIEVIYSNDKIEDIISLHEALKELSEEQNELFYLRDYAGYSYQEIALLTGYSVDNIKVKLFRAKKKLKEILGVKEKTK